MTVTNNLDGSNLTLGGTGTLAGSAVATQNFASAGTLTLGGSAAGNYSLSGITTNGSSVTIVPAIVTVTISGTKAYDGTTDAPASILSITDVVSGDTVGLSGTGVLAGKDVGNQTLLSSGGALTGLNLTGSSAGYYTLAGGSGSVDITPKALTIGAGVSANNKIYDGTIAATLSFSAPLLTGVIPGDAVNLDSSAYSASFAAKNAANSIPVTVSGLTLTGAQATNYSFTQPSTLVANITPKTLAVSGLSAGNKTYDATTNASLSGAAVLLAAEAVGTGTGSDGKPYSGDDISISGTAAGTFASKDAGNGIAVTVSDLTPSGAQASDYTLLMPTTLAANITAKSLTVSALSASNKVYDATTAATLAGTPAPLTAETAGTGTSSDGKPYSGDDISIAGTAAGTFASKDAGNGIAVTVSGLALGGAQAADYALLVPTGLIADIAPRDAVLSGSRKYDTSTEAPASILTVANNLDGANLTLSGTGILAGADVGRQPFASSGSLALSGSAAGNYSLTGITNNGSAVEITSSTVIVALTGTKVYDGTADAPASILTITNNVDGNNLILAGTGILAGKNVGSWALLSSGGTITGLKLLGSASDNYTLAGAQGAVTITPLPIILTGSKTFNGSAAAPASILTVANNVDGSDLMLSGSAILAGPNVGAVPLASTGTLALSGAAAGNYTLANATGAVTILPNVAAIVSTATVQTGSAGGTTFTTNLPATQFNIPAGVTIAAPVVTTAGVPSISMNNPDGTVLTLINGGAGLQAVLSSGSNAIIGVMSTMSIESGLGYPPPTDLTEPTNDNPRQSENSSTACRSANG